MILAVNPCEECGRAHAPDLSDVEITTIFVRLDTPERQRWSVSAVWKGEPLPPHHYISTESEGLASFVQSRPGVPMVKLQARSVEDGLRGFGTATP